MITFEKEQHERTFHEINLPKHTRDLIAFGVKTEAAREDLDRKFKACFQFHEKKFPQRSALSQLAAVANLSPFHFQRLFKTAYEKTPFNTLRIFD